MRTKVCIELEDDEIAKLWAYAKAWGLSPNEALKRIFDRYMEYIDDVDMLIKQWLREEGYR